MHVVRLSTVWGKTTYTPETRVNTLANTLSSQGEVQAPALLGLTTVLLTFVVFWVPSISAGKSKDKLKIVKNRSK